MQYLKILADKMVYAKTAHILNLLCMYYVCLETPASARYEKNSTY